MKTIRIIQIFTFTVLITMVTYAAAFAAVEFDVEAIEAEIVAAVETGADPVVAAKSAVANAVRRIVAANPDYPGGDQALREAIFEALANLKITGLDDTDLYVSANHALGNSVDPALEAYEGPGSQGRLKAKNRGGDSYGPGGKPKPGSPT